MTDPGRKVGERRESVEVEASRVDGREAFAASVQALVADPRPFAALGALDDVELMEAATELTRER